MVSPPRGVIWLCNSPLSSDNEHQIKFSSSTEQRDFFNNLNGMQIDYNYIRHENSMQLPLDYYRVLKYNYIVYQNSYVNDKWFFCFIDKIEFVNDKTTKVYLKTDSWQTWQFDVNLDKSFIERMHYTTDSYNSLSDTPDTGALIEYKSQEMTFDGGFFVFCNSDVTQDDTTSSNGYAFQLGNYSIPSMVLFYTKSQADSMGVDLQKIANKGFGDRINSVVYVPAINHIDWLTSRTNPVNSFPVCLGSEYSTDVEGILKSEMTFDFSNISLGHEKLLCFPYAKIVVQDLATGQSIELEPNKFDSKIIKFEIQSSISETPSYKIIPTNYKGQLKCYSDALVIKCNTSLPVANSTYAKYLMNNNEMNLLKMVGAGVGIAGSVVAGSPMGAITGFESITNIMLQERQAQKQPNQLSAITDGALERMTFQNGIRIMLMVMDTDHRNSADNFWKMYGYPIRTLGYPILTNDRPYNFIKLQSANISGDVPQSELEFISEMFSKGVTIWNKDNFRKY